MLNEVVEMEALALMRSLPNQSVDLILTDPPYLGVLQDEWDNQWKTVGDFIEWLTLHFIEFQRILKPNGSLYVFCWNDYAADVEIAMRSHFNVLNNIVWEKQNGGVSSRAKKEALRSYLTNTERIIFAEQKQSDQWASGESAYWGKLDQLRGFLFEPIRAYLDGARLSSGKSFDDVRTIVGCRPKSGLPSHWFTQSQWALPTRENYEKLQIAFAPHLSKEYESLRLEYESLRRPFHLTTRWQYTDVWRFPTIFENRLHPAQKPMALLRQMIEISTNHDAVVLDPFCGSGTTGAACIATGRNYILGDNHAPYVEIARARLAKPIQLNMI